MEGVTERRGGGRYRKFRAQILARDPWCTKPDCRNRSVELHHDPPLALGGRELHPDDARGVCRGCHKRLSTELRDALGLPYAPSRRTRQRAKTGPPRVSIGALDLPVEGPALVTYPDGSIRFIRRGEYG